MPVIGGEDGTYWIVTENMGDEVGVPVRALDPGMVEEHSEVDVAGQDSGEGFGRFEFGEPDIEVGGRGSEPRHGRRYQGGGGRGECPQAEPAGAKRPERVHFLASRGQAAGHGVCVAEQPGAGFGQRDALGAAQDERESQVAFEALNVLSDRGLGPAKCGGRGRQRASARHLAEDQQPPRVESIEVDYRFLSLVHE